MQQLVWHILILNSICFIRFEGGNGRVVRIFIREYALSKGVNWEFEKMNREAYLRAMIKSVTNLDFLKQII
ncbi:hypothetical protein DFR56_11674 [Pseudogracilibacillus auburnensis]|uniref:Fido domain-containing protein n=1 Tax=Pseudogracilibacillus auburnensis TaxID=1494959 RepID=A0A2V3VTR1_9BACI|nr:hypothetical protein DFR56_11674 [Pseudogracilibacillus auburnensis]